MFSGPLNTMISIEKEITTKNAVGSPVETYSLLKKTYATVKFTAGGKEFNEGEMPYTDTEFSLRYDSEINYKCRVMLQKEGVNICPALVTPNWTLGTIWSYGVGSIQKTIDGLGAAGPSALAIVSGKTYVVSINVKSISGSTAAWTLGGVSGGTLLAIGKQTKIITAISTDKLSIVPVATGLRININSISIKEMYNEYYKIMHIENIGRKDGLRLKCLKWDMNG
jgi:head-tail adaptor